MVDIICHEMILDVGDDALAMIGSESNYDTLNVSDAPKLKELCIVSMSSFILTLEAGVGNKTLPMLLMESSFQGNVNDWSSQVRGSKINSIFLYSFQRFVCLYYR